MARILLSLVNEKMLDLVTDALTDAKHIVVNLPNVNPEMGHSEVAKIIVDEKADAVVMDYWSEDAAGVKLMQTVTDQDGPFFIFIESDGGVKREEIVMALNEGARAFLPPDFTPTILLYYLGKGIPSSRNLSSKPTRGLVSGGCEVEMAKQEACLSNLRTRIAGYHKLLPYLLSTSVSRQNRKVLVVSDSPYQLEMIRKIMEDHSFQVLVATTASEGVEVAVQDGPHIIISDLELGESSGIDFCREVKLVKKVAPCYFVICTANKTKMDKVMVPGNGVDDCLLKPAGQYDTAEFVARVAMGILV